MSFKRINNITGWAVFAVAFFTYFLTREARGSLWDCGEFVACAYKLQLPHPPGAPMFTLLGRFFVILFGDDGMTAANAVNFMSALASAFTILFLFWTITHFGRKMFVAAGEELSADQLFSVMAAGIVGGLAYTFSDSFWFSAVEGEVYALSSFFTALVFWAMLKWEHADEKAGIDLAARARADRWIVFIFFMMGLSIGVHLLNLLTIPAIVMIYYYRRYQATTKGALLAFVVGCLVTGIVQVAVIQYSMKAAGNLDVIFVNGFGLPFFSGFVFYFILIAGLIYWAINFKEKTFNRLVMAAWFGLFVAFSLLPFAFNSVETGGQILRFLLLAGVGALIGYFIKPAALKIIKLSLWCYAFMMLGYLMYFTSIIRSAANPPIDMNNVDNPINLVYYLSREQYGSAPLVYGPHYSARLIREDNDGDGLVDRTEEEMRYVKGKDRYIPVGREWSYRYETSDKQIFPRVWDASNDQQHAEFYADWLGLDKQYSQEQQYEPPSYGDNINWFFSYQNGFMYWRYFMWNFAGKQNDVQGMGNKRDGNWISGISFMDNNRLGDQSKMPDSLKNNKANNKLYLIPFLLGVLGCIVHFLNNRKDWMVNFLLFIITGVGVVIYLNQPGNQPRERDYAYVTSFYAFAVWIGLAVIGFLKLAKEKDNKQFFQNTLLFGSGLTFLITLMSSPPSSFSEAIVTSLFAAVLFAAVSFVITYIVRAASGGGSNNKIANIASFAICAIAPLLMVQQEWDDHDRSEKLLAPDLARDYLESCAPNAILFSFGDNDTYPLWYAQEVEGVRKDIRLVNNSLLGIDWYINQLRYKVNNADSVDVIWSPEQIEGHNREYMYYDASTFKGDPNTYYDLYDAMKNFLGQVNIDPKTGRDVGRRSFPVRKFKVPVDGALVKSNGTVNPGDSVLNELFFEITENKARTGLMRNDLIILNIIAANKWKRPIYFTAPIGELGFGPYLRKDGLAYRLVPVQNKYPQANWTVETKLREESNKFRIGLGTQIRDNNDSIGKTLLEKYGFGNANKPGVYFDEENRRHLINIREIYSEAAGNLADAGKKEQAQQLIDKVEKGILEENMPYAMVSRFGNHNQAGLQHLEASYKAGKMDVAEKVRKSLRKDMDQQMDYYASLGDMSKAELERLFQQYESSIAAAQAKMMFAQNQEQQNQARNEMFVAENAFANSLSGRQRSLLTEIVINRMHLNTVSAIEQRYAPNLNTDKTTEGQKTITPGSGSKPDTTKPDTTNK
jgi:hypothetical protein